MRIGFLIGICVLLIGCGQKSGPILSHGNPVSYFADLVGKWHELMGTRVQGLPPKAWEDFR